MISAFTSRGTFTAEDQDADDDGPGWVANRAVIGSVHNNVPVELSTIAVNDVYLEDIDGADLAVDAWEWTISDPAGLSNINFSGFASGNEFDGATEGLVFELFLNNSATRSAVTEVNGDALDNWFGRRDSGNISLSDVGGASITTATVRLTFGRDGAEDLPNNFNEAIVLSATLSADLLPATPNQISAGRELHKTRRNRWRNRAG